MPTYPTRRLPGVILLPNAATAKLSDVEKRAVPGQRLHRPMPRAPYVVATYVSIDATCPSTCVYKGNGCFAQSGYIKRFTRRLDEDAKLHGLSGLEVARNEAKLLDELFPRGVPQDGARGGRDVRLHVGGDVAGEASTLLLASAAERWEARGGGAVWTYTHRWRDIPAEAWGPIQVWASCESSDDAAEAKAAGYNASITLPSTVLLGDKRQRYGQHDVIPCPWESRGVVCNKCRLCLDGKLPYGTVVGFKLHGQPRDKQAAERAWHNKKRLPVI